MDQPALAPEVVRATRTYLSALLPATEVDDAMHEVLADVSYWGDRDADAVLRMTHAVVVQRSRISDEAVVQALVGEVGIADDDRLARILSISPSAARRLREGVRTKLGSGIPAAEPAETAPVAAPAAERADDDTAAAAADAIGDEPTGSPPDGPVRIGFDDGDLVIPDEEPPRGASLGRSVALAFAIVWVIVAVVLLLMQR